MKILKLLLLVVVILLGTGAQSFASEEKSAAKPPKRCAACDEVSTEKCGACRKIKYCGRTCQKSDWARHKIECKTYEKGCIVCGKPAGQCGKCGKVSYCGTQHQRLDWSRHRLKCKDADKLVEIDAGWAEKSYIYPNIKNLKHYLNNVKIDINKIDVVKAVTVFLDGIPFAYDEIEESTPTDGKHLRVIGEFSDLILYEPALPSGEIRPRVINDITLVKLLDSFRKEKPGPEFIFFERLQSYFRQLYGYGMPRSVLDAMNAYLGRQGRFFMKAPLSQDRKDSSSQNAEQKRKTQLVDRRSSDECTTETNTAAIQPSLVSVTSNLAQLGNLFSETKTGPEVGPSLEKKKKKKKKKYRTGVS